MHKKSAWGIIFLILIWGVFLAGAQHVQQPDLAEFESLFDGQTLRGWRKLTEYSGDDGSWKVIEGVIVGEQYPEGKGGLLVTEKKFRNFELYAEVKADYPIDSGLFLRVQPSVLSYQVTIDYRPDGEVAAIYCPLGGDFLLHNPEGEKHWKKDEFNQVWIRIEGQPPRIQVRINGSDLVDFSDSEITTGNRVPESGYIGIQVHPGSSWGEGNQVKFRRLFVKSLDYP